MTGQNLIQELLEEQRYIKESFKTNYGNNYVVLEEKAEQGDAEAQYILGNLYNLQDEMTKRRIGRSWIEKAAAQGHSRAKKQFEIVTVPPEYRRSAPIQRRTSAQTGCYIATLVYGSYDCPQVWVLRRFRDYSLSKNFFGQTFIKVYYVISPIIVKKFGKTKVFNKFLKNILDSFVAKLESKGFENLPYKDLK